MSVRKPELNSLYNIFQRRNFPVVFFIEMLESMMDPYLSEEDKEWTVKFIEAVEAIVKATGVESELNMFVIADSIGLDLSVLHKEGTLMYAFYVAILNVLKQYLTMEDMKYPTLEDFLESYDGRFAGESEKEKNYLWHTANWMHLLFKMISARKNKGLAIQVVPKVVEGWDAKYVTGSGQTKATANRVYVFEVEGNTKASQRGKIKNKKKPEKKEKVTFSEFDNGDSGSEPAFKKPRKKRSPKLPVVDAYSSNSESNELSTRSRDKRTREAIATIYEAALVADTLGENEEDDSSNGITSDVKKAYYKLMRDSSCSSVLSFTRDLDLSAFSGVSGGTMPLSGFNFMPGPYQDLSRGITNSSLGGLDPLNFISLTGPSDLQRGFSWTEIPVNNGSSSSSSNVIPAGGSEIDSAGHTSSANSYDFDQFAPPTLDSKQGKGSGASTVAAAGGEEAEDDLDIDSTGDKVLSAKHLSDIFGGYGNF